MLLPAPKPSTAAGGWAVVPGLLFCSRLRYLVGAHRIRSDPWGCLWPVLPGSVTRGWQHRFWRAGCFGSPPRCQPSPCCATQANGARRRSRARRVGIAPPARTQLSNPGLSTALQRHWGGGVVQWRGCGVTGPELSLLWDGCSPSPTTPVVDFQLILLPKADPVGPSPPRGSCVAKPRPRKVRIQNESTAAKAEREVQHCTCEMRDCKAAHG